MASRYYNPLLARNLARAYQAPVYDFETGVKEAFEPMIQELKEQEERKRIEAEKYEKQMQKIKADQAADFRNMKSFDPNNLAEEYRPYAGQKLYDLQQDYKYVVENMQGFEKQQAMNEINQKIDTLKNGNLIFGEYAQDYMDRYDPDQDGGSRISNVNDATTIELDRRKANREWDEIVEIDGVPHFVFEPDEDSSFDEPITISLDEWDTAYKPLERQTAKYVAAQADFDDLITTAKRDLRWEDDPENISKIENILESQTYTKDEALSVAVDYLGLEQEQYAGIIAKDLDGDGVPGTLDDINRFIKDNLKDGVLTTLKNLHGAYNKQQAERDKQINSQITDSQRKQLLMQENQNYLLDQLETIKYPKDQKGLMAIESAEFNNILSQLGFAKVGKILDVMDADENITDSYINVRHNMTNEVIQVYKSTLTEDELKRMLLAAAGMSQQQLDMYYPVRVYGPQNVILPGINDQQTEN